MVIDTNSVFKVLSNYCAAIYYGGSRIDPVIDNPHDYDYICFAKHMQIQNLRRLLCKNNLTTTCSKNKTSSKEINDNLNDFSQIRGYPYTRITWFSYLDSLMIKVVGEDICPKTDVIYEHRHEFIKCLKEKADELLCGKIKNQKRWYHLLRGTYILINNSYDVTPEQRAEINTLHDLSEGWEKVRDKTIELVKNLK
jgi:hypothetical protein